MNLKLLQKYQSRILLLAVGALFAVSGACKSNVKSPDQSSQAYKEIVSTFYVGLAALDVGDDARAESKLSQLTQLAPTEPAGWANWGILALRQRNYEAAAQRLEQARSLVPQSAEIYYLIGLLETNRGHSAEAVSALRQAIELEPQHLRATYALALELERQGESNSEVEFQRLLQQILSIHPENLAALLEQARIAAKRSDTQALNAAVRQLAERSASWPSEVKQQVRSVQAAATGADTRATATQIVFLRNVLLRVAEYRQSLAAIKPPPGEEATPFARFLQLASPSFTPAPADTSLRFSLESVASLKEKSGDWIGAITLSAESPNVIALSSDGDLTLTTGAKFPFPIRPGEAVSPNGILACDLNYDFKLDFVLASNAGLRLIRQDTPDRFTDVSQVAQIPQALITANYSGAWAADIEADGDLDIVLGRASELPPVLRNNGDGTFTQTQPFADVRGLKAFVWGDLDGDGDPDAAMLDGESRPHVFFNERTGQFRRRLLSADLPPLNALAIADVNVDGILDLIVLRPDGTIARISDQNGGESWTVVEIARLPATTTYTANSTVHLSVADLDNNGGLDLMLASLDGQEPSGALIWLADERNQLQLLEQKVGPARFFGVADLNADGRLDLLGLTSDGRPVQAINSAKENYHWQIIRPRASQAVGDQRINSFGIGGEVEIRSGMLVQKQPITSPLLHFGLGNQTGADVVRIVWPNGSVRAEFEVKADQEIVAEQRLKGSCPFLFAFNGKRMEFVKDAAPWGSAIGLRINTLGTARVEATEEWYKIGRDQLVAQDGFYDLRITAELWETYYYDFLALMTVDHPAGTEIFVDERFVIPPVKLAVTTVSAPRKIARAIDDRGLDVTDTLLNLDGKYLDTFGRGKYQGVTRDHYVQVDLGAQVPESGPLWLIAQGWMHPTDSSINVAISQGRQEQAKPLSLEVPDGRGGWRVAQSNLGFPAGRKKICLFDISKVFRPGTPRQLRLRTNLEVYWDALEWASEAAAVEPKIWKLLPAIADLQYRGFSVINRANESSPELPDYNHSAGSRQRWRDLIGYYTRFGDVRELLAQVDDRYIIMNAGDEISLRFVVPPPPPHGWVRDFVFVGEGWIKDGDFNSTFSKTVLPLPYHGKRQYITAPGRLEDEWVYRRYPLDWQIYHTRYVTPDVFLKALRPNNK